MENDNRSKRAREKRGIHNIEHHDSEYRKFLSDAKDKYDQEVAPSVPCVEERTRDGTLNCEEIFEKSNASCC